MPFDFSRTSVGRMPQDMPNFWGGGSGSSYNDEQDALAQQAKLARIQAYKQALMRGAPNQELARIDPQSHYDTTGQRFVFAGDQGFDVGELGYMEPDLRASLFQRAFEDASLKSSIERLKTQDIHQRLLEGDPLDLARRAVSPGDASRAVRGQLGLTETYGDPTAGILPQQQFATQLQEMKNKPAQAQAEAQRISAEAQAEDVRQQAPGRAASAERTRTETKKDQYALDNADVDKRIAGLQADAEMIAKIISAEFDPSVKLPLIARYQQIRELIDNLNLRRGGDASSTSGVDRATPQGTYLDNQPDARMYKGHRWVDSNTGKIWESNGTKWVPTGKKLSNVQPRGGA